MLRTRKSLAQSPIQSVLSGVVLKLLKLLEVRTRLDGVTSSKSVG